MDRPQIGRRKFQAAMFLISGGTCLLSTFSIQLYVDSCEQKKFFKYLGVSLAFAGKAAICGGFPRNSTVYD